MSSTLHDDGTDFSPITTALIGSGFLLLLTLVRALIGRGGPATPETILGKVVLDAVGTLAMGGLVAGRSFYPRWAVWTTAGVMAGAVLLSVLLIPDPVAWEENVRGTAWMFPWFLLTTAIVSGRSAMCARFRVRTGWFLVGMGIVLSVVLLGGQALLDWITSWGYPLW